MAIQRSLFGETFLSEREQKNYAILELIRRNGPITKAEISQGTDMNIVTVSSYVDQFIRKGLVVEKGLAVSSGGRKPTLVELNGEAALAIGIDLGPMDVSEISMVAIVVDLAGNVVYKLKKVRSKEDMEAVLLHSLSLIKELIQSSKAEKKKLCGIGLGVCGIINEEAGTVRDSSQWGTRANFVGIVERIHREFELPVFIGNSVALAALGEKRFGSTSDVDNMLYLCSDIGCGIIINGNIYYGSTGSAGGMGVNLAMEEEESRLFGELLHIRPSGIDLGLIAQSKKLLAEGIDSKLLNLIDGDVNRITLQTIIKAAEANDNLAKELIQNAAIHLGMRIAYLVGLFNPDVVVIGGGIEQAGSLFLDPLSRTLHRWAFEEAGGHVELLPAQLGEDSVAQGAASLAVRQLFLKA